jgi:outer membrane protein TolC
MEMNEAQEMMKSMKTNPKKRNPIFRTFNRCYTGLFIVLGAAYSISCYSDSIETNLTLRAALEMGEKNNPQLQAVFNQWKGAEQNIAVQKSLPDPMLTYGYYFESVQTRVGPQNQNFSLSQKIPSFGKLGLMKAIATDQTQAMQARYQREKLNLNSTISQAYAELYYLKRSIDITQDRIRLVQDLEQVARTRYKAGSPMPPVLQAQVELGRLEDRLNSLRDNHQPLAARLNAVLNRPVGANLPWPANLPYRAISVDAASLQSTLRQTSPELSELAYNVDQGSHRVQLAKRERLPDLTFGVQYIDTGDASMSVANSGQDAIIGTVGINLPIWFGKNRAKIASANYQRISAELTLENRQQTLDAEISKVLYQLRDADRKINLYKESLIPKAKQSLEVNRKGFESGQMEFLNLIDAERVLLEFELSYERALSDHLIARAELSRLTGTDYLNADASTAMTESGGDSE